MHGQSPQPRRNVARKPLREEGWKLLSRDNAEAYLPVEIYEMLVWKAVGVAKIKIWNALLEQGLAHPLPLVGREDLHASENNEFGLSAQANNPNKALMHLRLKYKIVDGNAAAIAGLHVELVNLLQFLLSRN